DPLVYSDAPDPNLQHLFGFYEPESTPSNASPEPGSWLWPLATPACAAEDDLPAIGRRVDRSGPGGDELGVYRHAGDRRLELMAQREGRGVEARVATLYRDLVKAVAWQESCWRQFVEHDGKVTYLVSPQGDIGIMQVNRRIWRGFFDLEKLRWDIVYNSGAGAEILAQLLMRYGVREGNPEPANAARATYAAYNGGPGAYRRYRLARVPRAQRHIDQAFWQKYQTMAAGRAGADVLCL